MGYDVVDLLESARVFRSEAGAHCWPYLSYPAKGILKEL